MLTCLPLAAALALGLTPAPVTDLQFAPQEGLALRKRFERTESTKLKSSRTVYDGEERDAGWSQDVESEVTCVFTDRYLGLDAARVTLLERSFEKYEQETRTRGEYGGRKLNGTAQASNALSGRAVRFERDADDDGFVKSCEEAEPAQLAKLALERDYRALLPDEPVKLRAKWKIAAEDFRPLLDFDEDLPLEWTHLQDGVPVEIPTLEDEEPPEVEYRGELTARFDRLRKIKGRQLALIHLEGEIERVQDAGSENGGVRYDDRTTETLELKGECLWDVAGGHLHSLSIEADSTTERRNGERIEAPDQTHETLNESLCKGTLELEVAFERVE